MDPNAALREIREIVGTSDPHSEARLVRLTELVGGLDDWLVSGGFLPDDWMGLARR
jgi:hypothetical protein